MRKTFCVLPFIHAVYNPYDPLKKAGHVLPCCRYDSAIGEAETVNVSNPNKNSLIFKTLQDELSSGNKSKACQKCWNDEEIGVQSYRQGANSTYRDIIKSGEYKDKKLRFLEITPSNLCNLACRSCNSNFSSKWVPIDNFITSDRQKKSISYTDWRKLDLSNLLELKLMGGEPMLLKDNLELLKHLDEIGSLENIHLHVITNLMNPVTEEWKYFIKKSRKTYVWASIDAIGELNDYVRADSKWNTVEKNLLEIKELLSENPICRLSVNSVITILNVNKSLEIQEYFAELGIKNYMDVTSFPKHLDCKKLPDPIKNILIEAGVAEKVKDSMLNSDSSDSIVNDFFNHNDTLDKYHKKSFRDYNNDMYTILKGKTHD